MSADKKVGLSFDYLEDKLKWLVPEWFINGSLRFIFSKTSIVLHTIWFIYWFVKSLDVGLLTNIVSLEAIYIGVFIGIQQTVHHSAVKSALKNS